jgi:uncharacterized protein
MNRWIIWALGLCTFLISTVRAQPIYRWGDHDETIHYRQHPPLPLARQQLDEIPQSFSQGLLWQIGDPQREKKPQYPSYLFGTIHSEDQRVARLPEAVREALGQSDMFCMELLPDPATTMTLTKSMRYTDEYTLREAVGQDLFGQLAPLMQQRGIPVQILTKLKPWAVYMTLSMPPPKTGQVLDVLLYEQAKRAGKKLCGIETAEEQVAVFEQTPLLDQMTLLRELVSDPQAADIQLQTMIPLYLQGDLARLAAISSATTDTNSEVSNSTKTFLKRLIDERNQRMLERILPQLNKQTTFIAVGALHLPGQFGLLQLLADHGYSISAVY